MAQPKIILTHGIFEFPLFMTPLANKLEALGYETVHFCYRSVRQTLEENTRDFAEFIQKETDNGESAVLIGHSLGSLVIQFTLEAYPELNVSHAIAITPPFQGSTITQNLEDKNLSFIVGRALNALLPQKNRWNSSVPLGVIAGTKSFGVTKLFLKNDRPNDGTLYVDETKIEGMTDHITLPESHTEILLSKELAELCDAFIQHTTFNVSTNTDV
ncbi:alpha/beta hydrolase [Ignatzschineria sp. RMDPL8A]|uniref:esterase/lipase family protein n=1 Tax=Ignatzschineria sp. RMDPL8A TaxID=2999236 RepID=UPI0024466E68|nr:alpha/beta hydrolase [Ignatzschineria sp. RMDPL8A]MDG9730067.1 alpha/beta hydrolase [Ignatzschineria sp. RMDPL8A]